jgi:hypothetical protein
MMASDLSVGSGGGARERPVIMAMNSFEMLAWIRGQRKGVEGEKGTIEVYGSVAVEIDFFDYLGELLVCWVLARCFHYAAEFLDCDVS